MEITLYGIICILGIMENGLVIWIAGFRMKKTINAVWLLHLAIADFLCSAFLALFIVSWADLIDEGLQFIFSILTTVSLIIALSVSILLLTAMSVDRWVSVMWPFWAKVHRTQKLAKITAGVIWIFCLVVTGIVCYFVVMYNHRTSEIMKSVDLVRLVVLFVIPFLIISTSYVTILLKIRKSKRPQRSQRPYRIITAVILCFFICWAPFNIWPFIPKDHMFNFHNHIFHTIINFFAFLNSCINPIIYVFMDQDFRDGFLRSIPFRLQRASREHPDDPRE
ncbi:hypothetical protein GDO81_027154 [Engystomops pustulosus]|uniref:G-protein coupled receptors family 1 profile domain-containing protein n=1 Tax=Engystomops pustulosus TaxID=76066 RepID=A0AAV6YZQ2_ENGPU|nr:hypothetical protein GDO81_027154 [Engystomops pustulosus]